MKKLGKLIFGTAVLASIAAGAYYIYKKFINKDSTDEFDDFEDDFEDFETDDDAVGETREYVPINITNNDSKKTESADAEDAMPAEKAAEDTAAAGENEIPSEDEQE